MVNSSQKKMTESIEIYVDSLKGEVWKVVEGYDNYFVSNYGRVYGMYQRKVLKPFLCGQHPYRYVKLCKKGIQQNMRLHRLIAMTFVDNPDHKPIVHHIDGNVKNNNADNLMWVTADEHKNLHRQMRTEKKGETV